MDYTKLDYFNSTFCPNCGKLLKTNYHDDGSNYFDLDEYRGSYNSWETCRCKECKISGDGSRSSDYSLSNPNAWKFPKDYNVTVTQKQLNYIKYLAEHFHKHVPYISNKELAISWIGQFVKLLEDEKREELNDKNIIKVFKKYGYDYCGKQDLHDGQKINELHFNKKIRAAADSYDNTVIYLYYNTDTKELTTGQRTGKLDKVLLEYYINALNKLPDDMNKIINDLNKLTYPTEQAGKEQIEKDKQQLKEFYEHRRDYDDYDDYDTFDGSLAWEEQF